MNKFISFILGALVMFVIMFSIDVLKDDSMDVSETADTNAIVDIVENKGDITKQIAFVNNDVGVGETNVAASLLENMPMSSGYDLVTTTYNNATTGLENDDYVAYVMFDAGYSTSLLSVATDELPEKAKITLKINPNLNDEQLAEVNKVLFADYMYIKDTVNYIYIAYLLDIVHNTQNDVTDIIGNEEYMNSISESVANYTANVTESLEDYLKEPPSTEIDLDVSGLQGLMTQNIDQISAQLGIDSESLLATITAAQASFMTNLNQSLLESNIAPNNIDLNLEEIGNPDINSDSIFEQLNGYLETNIVNISSNRQTLADVQLILSSYSNIVQNLPTSENIELLNILETMVVASINNDSDMLSVFVDGTGDDDYKFEVINNFVLSYANWYAINNGITLGTCSTDTCMADFNSTYGMNFDQWHSEEEVIKEMYDSIANNESTINNTISDTMDDIDSILNPSTLFKPNEADDTNNYINDVLDPENTNSNIDLTDQYCAHNYPNYVANFACGLRDITTNYSAAIDSIDSYNQSVDENNNTIAEHNSDLASEAEEINSSISAANEEVNEKLTTYGETTVDNVETKVNDTNEKITEAQDQANESISNVNGQKDEFITDLSEKLLEYQTQLNENIDSVEDSQYDDREGLYKDATKYLEDYSGVTDGYTSNIDALTLFASILPSTRNGNDANYYLYEYLVNPLDVVQKTGITDKEETVDPIESDDSSSDTSAVEKQEDKDMFALLIIALILIAGLVTYLIVRKEDYED